MLAKPKLVCFWRSDPPVTEIKYVNVLIVLFLSSNLNLTIVNDLDIEPTSQQNFVQTHIRERLRTMRLRMPIIIFVLFTT